MAYGTVNADIIQSSVSGVSLGAGNASIMKNRIINGAMVIDQRNAGASVTASSTGALVYTVDRWCYYADAASKFSVQQSAVAPTGFSNSLLVTSLSAYSVGASEAFGIQQSIEAFNTADLGLGTAAAKTLTLSFWVRSSLTGAFGGSLRNPTNLYSYPFGYTINSANTWEQKTITISGPTAGSWVGATNGVGLRIWFSLGNGTSFDGTANSWASANYLQPTGSQSVVGTSGATFYITGVQLEVGSSATGFEYRQYGQELALCQRYYYQMNSNATALFARFAYGQNITVNTAEFGVPLPVTMRAAPSIYTSGSAAGYGIYYANAVTALSSVPSITTNGTTSTCVTVIGTIGSNVLVGGGASVLLSNNTASSYIGLSAEL